MTSGNDTLDTAPGAAVGTDNGALRVVMERLGALATAFVEVKALVQSIDTRMRQAELDRVSAAAVVEAEITAAHTRLDGHAEKLDTHATDIKDLKAAQATSDKRLSALEPAYRLMLFVASALGLSVIGLIWALITGAAKVTFGG